MVPRCSITSSRFMPMPLSRTVTVRASLSHSTSMAKLAVALEQALVGQRLEAQLVAGVGGVGDQLPQEDLLVAVEGVDHQIQQLADLGLETVGGLLGHGWSRSVVDVRKEAWGRRRGIQPL